MTDDINFPSSHNNTEFDLETRQLLRATKSEGDDSAERISKLEAKVANLSLLNESLWHLLTQRTKLNDADMLNAINNTQQQRKALQDAKLRCVKCNLHNAQHQKKCAYCGGELTGHIAQRPFHF